MRESVERKKAKRIFLDAIILIAVFAIFTVIIYSQKEDQSYSNIKEAISKVSKGGTLDTSYNFKGGVFTFIKGSKKMDYGYFYKKNNLWYHRKKILSNNYHINNKYEVTTYYVKDPNYYFIEVKEKNETIKELSDSINSTFTELEILENDKVKKIYFSGNTNELTTQYYLEINGEKYFLDDYSKTKNIQ